MDGGRAPALMTVRAGAFSFFGGWFVGRDEWVFAAKLAAVGLVALSAWLRSRPAARLGFEGDSNGSGGVMRTRYRPGDKKTLKLALADAAGHPTDYTAEPVVWGSTAPEVAKPIPSPDGLSAVIAFGAPGAADVQVSSGPLAASVTFTVGGPAAALGFADDDPAPP